MASDDGMDDLNEFPDETYASAGTVQFASPDSIVEIFNSDNSLAIKLAWDGTVETGESYRPDDAAEAFWKAVTEAALHAK